MTRVVRVDGAATEFESFMFAEVDREGGKLGSLVERSVWGPAGEAPENGAK